MEVLGVMKVNDGETGELLEMVKAVFLCDDCTADEFSKRYGECSREYLENMLDYDYSGSGAIVRIGFCTLDEDFDDDDDYDNDDDNDDDDGYSPFLRCYRSVRR